MEYKLSGCRRHSRIERLELRLIRLPLVRFFETSFGRVYDRTFVLVTASRRRTAGARRVRGRRRSVLQRRNDRRPRGTSSRTSSRRSCSDARSRIRATCFRRCARCAATTWPRPPSRWPPGICAPRAPGVPLSRPARRHAPRGSNPGVSIGIQDSLDQLAERIAIERAAGYRRIKIKIKPGWDVNAVEMVREQFDGVPLMVDANAAYTLADAPHLAAPRSLRPDDDRAAAGVRRHPRSRRAAAAAVDARSASTSRSTPSARRRRRSRSARAASSTSSRAASAGTPNRSGCTTPPPRTAFRCGTAGCSRAASAARTTSICRRCRISRCRATSRPAAGTSRRISSTRRSRSSRRRHRCSRGARHRRDGRMGSCPSIDNRNDRSEAVVRATYEPNISRSRLSGTLAAASRAACASAPPQRQQAPAISVDQKMAWMLQLEDQRILRRAAASGAACRAAARSRQSGRGAGSAADARPAQARDRSGGSNPAPRRAGDRTRRACPKASRRFRRR